MISSEVQRTLVKSPPELWAELSDPATLARHLRELGEIRITRIDPEQAVEWEAEDATGSVRIKPSGWGTKVTLTVTRRMPEAPLEVAQIPEAPREMAQIPEAPHEIAEYGSPVNPEPPAEAAREAEAEPETAGGAELELPVEHIEPERQAEAEPEPTGEAEFESEATGEAEFEPAVEAEPETITDAQPEDQPAPSDAIEEYEQDPGSESRRGFFARLFRREPKEAAAEPEPPVATVWSLPEPSDASATGPQPPEPAWAVATPRPAPEQIGSGEPSESPESIELPEAVEPPESADAIETVEAFRPVATTDPAETIDAADAAGAVDSLDLMQTIHALPAVDLVGVTERTDASNDPEAVEVLQEHADAQAADISAELRAAEDVAAEQVTTVLTEVLDRLGAAHHRPFSRS